MRRRLRLAVFAHGGHADVLRTVPYVRALRRAHPDAHMVVFGPAHAADLWERCPYLDGFVASTDGVPRGTSLRARLAKVGLALRVTPALVGRFDVTVNLDVQPQGGLAGLLGLLTLARRRIGYGGWRAGINESAGQADLHVSYEERAAHLLRRAGICVADDRLDFWVTAQEEQAVDSMLAARGWRAGVPLVVCHAGSDWSCQTWPDERWARVADGLADQYGAWVAFSGVAADRDRVASVSRLARRPIADLTGCTTYGQLAALLARATVVISTDTLVAPLAAAVGSEVVTLPAYDTSNWSADRLVRLGAICGYRELGGRSWSAVCHWRRSAQLTGCVSASCVGLHGMGRIAVEDVLQRAGQKMARPRERAGQTAVR